MTLRFVVSRILRELIELAEDDADAELVDALHDALDVAMPAPAITASTRPRSRATWSDSTPRPRRRGRWQVASTAARSDIPNGRACPRPRSPAVRRYPASTRAVRSPAGVGCPASFARKHAAATAIEALEEARPASCSSAR